MAFVHSLIYGFIQQAFTVAFWVAGPVLGPRDTEISRTEAHLSESSQSSGWDRHRSM